MGISGIAGFAEPSESGGINNPESRVIHKFSPWVRKNHGNPKYPRLSTLSTGDQMETCVRSVVSMTRVSTLETLDRVADAHLEQVGLLHGASLGLSRAAAIPVGDATRVDRQRATGLKE